MGEALEIVKKLYKLTDSKKTTGLEDLLANDMVFVGPVMRSDGAKQYITLNEQLLPFHIQTRMKSQFEKGDEVCSIYEMDLRTPSGGAITLQVADWIRTEGGKVAEQRIYYDPREFAEAFGTP
jgi:ketosteroid isomerase-like protein